MEAPSEPLEGTTLHHLLSKDENRLLDTIDELRSQGVGKLLGEKGLPQIIVCGDQSSGKSSVLEALTRVRFPTRSSVCTTFPTELRLRREPSSRISCRIKPSANRSKEEKERLARFTESFQSPERFPDLITAARKCMSESSDGANRGHGSIGGFFEDVLEVEIVGPKMAPLTIVDLPGLIHYRNASTGDNDIKLVRELVERYMKLDNSIILAVVSAHNDISNQVVLNQIEKTVQDGKRTLGIITKPDELPAGSEKEDEYLEHARMNPNKFQYGWHVVRNRSYEEQSSSFDERDETEKRFFSSSSWASLPRRQVGLGIDSLRQKLSKMLLDHISTSLPSIVQQLEADFNQSEAELAKLGEARSKPKDQYNYLSDISDNFGEYVKDALSGRYHRKSFFGDPLSPEGLEKRLRANIRNLNDEFATRMLERGHKWHVVEDAEMLNIRLAPRSKQVPDHPNVMSKSDFLKDFVDTLAYRERGNELPGMSNPLLVGSLFRQQSEPWRDMAMEHLDTVWIAVKDFLEALLAHLTDERTCKQLLIHVIHPAMEERQQSLSKKLEELMVPHRDQDPLDINPQFVRKILSQREKRVAKTVIEQLQKDCDVNGAKTPTIPTVDQVMAKLEADSPPVDNKYGSLESFEFMQAYYEVKITTYLFIKMNHEFLLTPNRVRSLSLSTM
jgi:GTPase SAR1 family protein